MAIKKILVLAVMIMILAVSAAAADTLFEDDFESGTIDPSKWTVVDSPAITSDPDYVYAGAYSVLFNGGNNPDDQLISVDIDSTGMNDISVSYYRMIESLESDNDFMVEYSVDGGDSWTVIENIDGSLEYSQMTENLPAEAENNPNLQLRFRINAGEVNGDFAAVDNVLVTGEPGDFTAPEITEPWNNPEYPTTSDNVQICADVTDESGISSVSLHWDNGIDEPATFVMNPTTGDTYCRSLSSGTLAAFDGMEVVCQVTALDTNGNEGSSGEPTVCYVYDGADPVPGFECTPTEGSEPLEVVCTSTSTDTVDESLTNAWSFPGGNPSSTTDEVVTVVYTNNGMYDVSLTVTDDAGHSDSLTQEDYINVLDIGPEASFTESVHEFGETVTVFFTDTTTSYDELVSWMWDFGDGETSTEQNPSHTYADEGEYTVTLTVYDVDGDFDTATDTKYVYNEAPTINAGGPYFCNEASTIMLSATATDVPADYPLTYAWDLDDEEGYETIGQSVMYLCGNGDDSVLVEVQVTDNDGDAGYAEAAVNINNVAPMAFLYGPFSAAAGQEVCFAPQVADVEDLEFSYAWDLDNDGQFDDSESNVACTSYSEQGTYPIAVRAFDGDDWSNDAASTVTVYSFGIELEPGWNLISIPLVPTDTNIEAVLNEADVEVVWAYQHNPETGENEWYSYSPDAPEEVNDLETMVPGYGYYVYVSEEYLADLNLGLYNNGDKYYEIGQQGIPMPPQVTLTSGWNLIGHFGMNEVAKSEEIQDLSGGSLTDLADLTLLGQAAGPINYLEPGVGYWVFVTGQGSLLYAPSEADYAEDQD